MSRERFEQELQRLKEGVLALGGMVEQAVRKGVESLRTQDLTAARRIIEEDTAINERRFEIENEVLTAIATQQPMAGDLRMLVTCLELAAELERMADYAKGIANIALMIGTEPLVKPLVDIPRMAEMACGMLRRALHAFAVWDVALARAVPEEDSAVDAVYERIYRDLAALIIADPRTLDQSIHLTWAAHNLERLADRVTNICERIVFTVTGRMEEMARP
jgi:phosphate transport system protein